MENLPDQMITEILRRLPAKSICRFRCVSKSWLAFVSKTEFIKVHQNTHKLTRFLCDSKDGTIYTLPCNQHDDEKPKNLSMLFYKADFFVFYGSCNGLILCTVDDIVNYPWRVGFNWLAIFNPTTRDFFKVPENCYRRFDMFFGSQYRCGFGYDSLNDDYKVVMIPADVSVHVYSLRNNTWRRVMDSPYDHSDRKNLSSVFVNGFLHWIANRRSDHLPVIVAFSLANETFREVPSPDLGIDVVDIMSKSDCKLVVLGEKLGLLFTYEVWFMNEYGVGESWSKIIIHGVNEFPIVKLNILYVDVDGKILLANDGNLLWVYDVEDKSFCKTIDDISGDIRGLMIKGTYVESLVSLKIQQNKSC